MPEDQPVCPPGAWNDPTSGTFEVCDRRGAEGGLEPRGKQGRSCAHRSRRKPGRKGRQAATGILAIGCALLAACQAAPYDEPHMLAVSGGPVGIADSGTTSRLGLEYRFGEHTEYKLIPSLGVAVSDRDAFFLSAELRRNFWLLDRLILTPSFGVGYFNEDEALDLGGELEFRSGIEMTYCLPGDWRIGWALFHLSNGGLSDSNPGTEALVITLALPVN